MVNQVDGSAPVEALNLSVHPDKLAGDAARRYEAANGGDEVMESNRLRHKDLPIDGGAVGAGSFFPTWEKRMRIVVASEGLPRRARSF